MCIRDREKGSIFDDALDDKEYEGNLIYLLKSGSEFIRNNSKVRFVKEAQYRVCLFYTSYVMPPEASSIDTLLSRSKALAAQIREGADE